MLATNVATGLEIEGEDHIRPVTSGRSGSRCLFDRKTTPCGPCAVQSRPGRNVLFVCAI
jgi:hypothetical protein